MNAKLIVFLALVAVALCNPVEDSEETGKDKRSLLGLGLGIGLYHGLAAPYLYNPYPYYGPIHHRVVPYGPSYVRTTIYG